MTVLKIITTIGTNNSPSICLVGEKLDVKPVMPDPRWLPAEALLAYFICAMDWADAEFENIAVCTTNIYTNSHLR